MKNINKQLSFPVLFFVLVMIVAPLFQSCNKDDDGSNTVPEISYVRITDPLKADSLLDAAYLGNTVALMGKNLVDMKQIFFNDQEALLNTSFITNSTIIVTIPSTIPKVVTDSITMITYSGIRAQYPFRVLVPAPKVSSLVCEYVAEGQDAVIKGDFFIENTNKPLEVIFPGNIKGIIKSSTINEIVVTVPKGAGVGPISVKSLYGSTRSTFYFRDDRNIILDFDNLTAAGGWRSGKTGNSNPASVSGNYVRFQGNMAGGAGATWDEDNFSFNLWCSSNGRPDVPLYSGNLATAVIKFECNVAADWKSSALQMIFTPYTTSGTNSYIGDSNVPRGLWIPWKESGSYKTTGWTTVTLPLSDFVYTPDGKVCATKLETKMLGGLTFFVWSGGVAGTDCTPHICIDNIRIVPE